MVRFICNICSATNEIGCEADLHRDNPSCTSCGSNVRFRWTIHALSLALFGKSVPLRDFPDAPQATGIGLSDEPLYADVLASKLSYVNTFLHREPRFDLTDPACGEPASLDFILATEVFEHIPPPVQPAFHNLARLLKPDGFVVFSTPWRPHGHTVEHFPGLYRWTVTQIGDEYVVVNKRRNDTFEVFDELVFHGGMGHTLEMRVFSQPDLVQNFRAAGLEPQWAMEPYLEYGICFSRPWSIPCVVRKARSTQQEIEHSIAPEERSQAGQGDPAANGDPSASRQAAPSGRDEVAELYQELDRQTAHAYRLTSEIGSLTEQLQSARGKIEALQSDLEDKRNRLASMERERDLVKNSKWVKLGRRLHLGPRLA